MAATINKELLRSLSALLESGKMTDVHVLIEDLHAADIAELARELSHELQLELLQLLDSEKLADVLAEFEEDERAEILEHFTGKELAETVVDHLESDDAADLISELPEEKKREVFENLDDVELAKDLADLLTHREGTAGALMGTEIVMVNQSWTVTRCVREMRRQAEDVDVVHAVYVVDDNDVLKGSLSLKKLLTTSARTPIEEVYNQKVHSVLVTEEDEEVAKIMKKYDLFVIPVVDDLGRLLGRITLDDIVDVIQEEADSNYQLMSGLSEEVEYGDSLYEMTRARLPWLLVGLLGGLIASQVIAGNEEELRHMTQIAFFIPLIAAMGGNVGVQSSAIVVQALANDSIQRNLWERLLRELGVGLLNGTILAALVFAYTFFISGDQPLLFASTIGLSMLAVILFASLFGTAVPWILDYYGIDPALATGPFITTTNDVLGLTIYFSIASMLML